LDSGGHDTNCGEACFRCTHEYEAQQVAEEGGDE